MTNSHYSRRESGRTVGLDPARVTVVYHGVPDPFGELPAGPRERLALTVGVVDRRNLEPQGAAALRGGGGAPARRLVRAGRASGRTRTASTSCAPRRPRT